MRYPDRILALTLLLAGVAALSACGAGETPAPAPPEPQGFTPPEGQVGILRHGNLTFGDSELSWEVFTSAPLTVECSLIGPKGYRIGPGPFPLNVTSQELGGSWSCRFSYSHVEVLGEDLLEDLRYFAGRAAAGTLAEAAPGLADSSGFKFTLATETAKKGGGARSTSIQGRNEGMGRRGPGDPSRGHTLIAGATGAEEGAPDLHRGGEPIWLAYCVEMAPDGSVQSSSWDTEGGEFAIVQTEESGETTRIPIGEYRRRAWALRVTFLPAD